AIKSLNSWSWPPAIRCLREHRRAAGERRAVPHRIHTENRGSIAHPGGKALSEVPADRRRGSGRGRARLASAAENRLLEVVARTRLRADPGGEDRVGG